MMVNTLKVRMSVTLLNTVGDYKMKLQCVSCGLKHTHKERAEDPLTTYSRCPQCGCGGFIKLKWCKLLK